MKQDVVRAEQWLQKKPRPLGFVGEDHERILHHANRRLVVLIGAYRVVGAAVVAHPDVNGCVRNLRFVVLHCEKGPNLFGAVLEVKLALHVADDAHAVGDVEPVEAPRDEVLIERLRVDQRYKFPFGKPVAHDIVLGRAEPLGGIVVDPFREAHVEATLPGDADGGGHLKHLIPKPPVAAELTEGYHRLRMNMVQYEKPLRQVWQCIC